MPRDIPAVDVAGILKRAGLTALELTRAEATRVEETPGIGWVAFSNLFDGHRKSEGPQCSSSRFPGYNKFFCADDIVQPFVPHAAGKPGLYFRLPTVIKTPENQKHMKQTIHVLSNTFQGDKFYYRGKYTRVPIPENQFHWSDLPHNVRILNLCYSSDKDFITFYSFGIGGSNVLVIHGLPPSVPSVHVSNLGTNTGASPPLWRSRPI